MSDLAAAPRLDELLHDHFAPGAAPDDLAARVLRTARKQAAALDRFEARLGIQATSDGVRLIRTGKLARPRRRRPPSRRSGSSAMPIPRAGDGFSPDVACRRARVPARGRGGRLISRDAPYAWIADASGSARGASGGKPPCKIGAIIVPFPGVAHRRGLGGFSLAAT